MRQPYSFYKGAARAPIVFGLPRNVFLMTFGMVMCLGLALSKAIWFSAPILYLILFRIYSKDPDGLQLVMLHFQTTIIHKIKDGKDESYQIEEYSEHLKKLK